MSDGRPAVPKRASEAGRRPTPRQLEVLRAVHETGGQNAAARRLGMSPAAVSHAVNRLARCAGLQLFTASEAGTVLTDEGLALLRGSEAMNRMALGTRPTAIGGTIITEELLLAAMSQSDPDAECDLVLSDDGRNVRALLSGDLDMALLDDPLNAYDLEGFGSCEVVMDRLVHVDSGPRYARFKYGAQRVGFRHLESIGAEVVAERTFRSLNSLISSGLSYFVNESLLMRRGIGLRSSTDPALLSHSIVAVWRDRTVEVDRALQALERQVRSGKY